MALRLLVVSNVLMANIHMLEKVWIVLIPLTSPLYHGDQAGTASSLLIKLYSFSKIVRQVS